MPTIYTPDLIEALSEQVCELISEGKSLRQIALMDGMPSPSTFLRWVAADKGLESRYARARDVYFDLMAEQTLDIADDGLNDTYVDENGNRKVDHDVVHRSKLRIDARKWLLSKLANKKYGDSSSLNIGGQRGENPIQSEDVSTRELARMFLFNLEKSKREGGE